MRAAVALSYTPGIDTAPQVISSGRRDLASEMERVARRYGVPIVEDRTLTERLLRVAVPEEIPEELYLDVAEILVRTEWW